MTFRECVMRCWDHPGFLDEYRRLRGVSLGKDNRSTLERMIDKETGFVPPALDEKEVTDFLDFIRDVVWAPLFVGPAPGIRKV